MSSDITRKLARNAGIAMILAASALLSACQVRPLYSESSGVTEKLSSVGFSEASGRVGQQVRNRLIFLASRGAGEAANPQYHVELRTTSSVADTLLRQSGDTSRAGRVTVTVTYTLSAVADGRVIKAGSPPGDRTGGLLRAGICQAKGDPRCGESRRRSDGGIRRRRSRCCPQPLRAGRWRR